MRKIKYFKYSRYVYVIRVYVLEAFLSQKTMGKSIDYSENKLTRRVGELYTKKRRISELYGLISSKQAARALKVSFIQSKRLEKDEFSVVKFGVADEVAELSKYLYEEILFNENYWWGLNCSFSKMKFKEDFFESQGNSVCPYCDLLASFSYLEFQVDHLLPKNYYPMLCINENNLFPCCVTCNHQHYGKGDRYKGAYYNLYENEIGSMLKFNVSNGIKLVCENNVAESFVDLLKLDSRYDSIPVKNHIKLLEKKIRKDVKKTSNKSLLSKESAFYFVSKNIYDDCLDELHEK